MAKHENIKDKPSPADEGAAERRRRSETPP